MRFLAHSILNFWIKPFLKVCVAVLKLSFFLQKKEPLLRKKICF